MLYNTQEWLDSQEQLCYSLDLDEATYRISQDTMEDHFDLLGDIFSDNPIWEVYGDMFRITKKELDLSLLKEQGFDVPAELVIEQGSFMGDSLSFMHLTMLLSTAVTLASSKDHTKLFKELVTRPFGQSIGDDLLLLNARKEHAEKLTQVLTDLKAKVSKINSYFENGVFTEQYFAKVLDERDRKEISPESLFGDLWFVDSIKVMLLTGKPKVSSEKRNSFIGQANALNKQLKYLPKSQFWKRLRCRVYLWVANYDEAVRLGRAKPHLPPELGGLDVPIGACDSPESDLMKSKYIPYFCAMLALDQNAFLGYYLLLKGIFKSTPKGVPWSNDPDRVTSVTKDCVIVPRASVDDVITKKDHEFYLRMGQVERLRYLKRVHGWISASEIDEELSRRETYLEFWYNPEVKRAFRTLRTDDATTRHKIVWDYIRATLKPAPLPYYMVGDNQFGYLAEDFRRRTWGFFVNKDDPSIQEIFEGNTSLFIELQSKFD